MKTVGTKPVPRIASDRREVVSLGGRSRAQARFGLRRAPDRSGLRGHCLRRRRGWRCSTVSPCGAGAAAARGWRPARVRHVGSGRWPVVHVRIGRFRRRRFQILHQLLAVVVAIGRRLGERPCNDRRSSFGSSVSRGTPARCSRELGRASRSVERELAGQHVLVDDRQAVLVALPGRFAFEQFRSARTWASARSPATARCARRTSSISPKSPTFSRLPTISRFSGLMSRCCSECSS